MSFNGCTGCGKNFVSHMIIDNMYNKFNAGCVHKFNAEVDFKHRNMGNNYKIHLRSLLHDLVLHCPRFMFVFDKVDHMPEELLYAIKPYLGTNPSINGVDYRKAIFIFLSNVGDSEISQIVYEAHKMNIPKSKLRLTALQEAIACQYDKGKNIMFQELIEANLIDYFVPFLPLEKHHVSKCIEREIEMRFETKIAMEVITDKILEELEWFPPVEHLFSTSGCKKIANKLQILV